MFTLAGLAVPFHEVATVGRGRRLFQRGAFTHSLKHGQSIEARLNHGRLAFASEANDSLKLCEQPDGLFFWLEVWDAHQAAFLRAMAAEGALTGVSACWKYEQVRTLADSDIGIVTSATLVEISVMTYPQQPAFRSTWVRPAARAAA